MPRFLLCVCHFNTVPPCLVSLQGVNARVYLIRVAASELVGFLDETLAGVGVAGLLTARYLN